MNVFYVFGRRFFPLSDRVFLAFFAGLDPSWSDSSDVRLVLDVSLDAAVLLDVVAVVRDVTVLFEIICNGKRIASSGWVVVVVAPFY